MQLDFGEIAASDQVWLLYTTLRYICTCSKSKSKITHYLKNYPSSWKLVPKKWRLFAIGQANLPNPEAEARFAS